MKKLLVALMTAAAALSLAATAEAQEKLKACWVYTGPIGDFGYSYQHDQGRLDVEKALGDKVETAYLENVSEGPDADRAFERLAREGCKIIFGTSFGFMDPEVKVAKKFPDVMFEHATGYRVSVGDHVSRGEVVGYVGSTGWSTGCHLHFTILQDGNAVDPMNYL